PAPVGAPGELCLGGASVARDYLGRPDLTAERFVGDPFAADPGARLYRTGDRVRWLADGNIEYLGRLDNQVKLRGFRIELGEIEAVLQQDDGVGDAIVVLREDEAGDKKLVAYVVGQGGAVPDVEQLRQSLKARLPEYMVPGAFVMLQALPLSPNGKVDRKALPAPSGERQAGSDYVEPGTRTERELAAIWSSVLKVDRVGVHDNFFELGGHSLLATRVASQIAAALGREMPLRELFQRPKLGELAAYLDGHVGETQALAPIVRADRSGDVPLSYAQQRLWFLDRYEPQSAAYNIPMAMRLKGRGMDAAKLQAVFAQLVARHESLRTAFDANNGEAVQVIREELDVPVRFDDLSGLPQDAREAKAAQLLEQEAGEPFDLAEGPLLRVGLVKLGEDEHILLLTMHHIVSDGWSMGVLVDEVAQIYRAHGEGRQPNLPPLAIQYADYAVWQRDRLQGEVLQQQLGYWRDQLEGAPTLLELPTDRPRPTLQSHQGAVHDFTLPAQLTGRLKELAQAQGATLFMLLQAAFAVLLHRLSGQDDICIGTPIAGRNRAELEGLIGFFVNTLVLRSRIDPNARFDALLEQSKEAALGAYAHQDVPFEQLVEHLKPPRSLSYTPLFQVMFILQNAPRESLEIPGLRFEAMASATRTAKFDLTCSLVEEQDRLYGTLEYSTGLFDEATIARMAQHYEVLLQGICDAPDASVRDLPLLTTAQRHQVLVEWNATETPYSRDHAVHQLFEEQARRNPEAVALAYEQRQFTYAQLNARANQLAHHLRQLGAGPERLVGICMRRSPEMVVGLLAVLKAGAAYVPMDPAYPAQRLQHMLQDSAAAVVLVDTAGRHALPGTPDATVLHLRDDAQRWAKAPAADVAVQAPHTRHLAYVIYTSGSTGQPKGVMVEHRSLCNLVGWHCRAFGLGDGQRSAATAGVGFDASTWEIWPPLCSGGTLVLPPARVEGDATALLQWWRGQALDVSFLVTPLAELAFSEGWNNPGLGVLLVGGDRLRQVPRLEGTRLVNNYGPTETTVVATSGPVHAGEPVVHIGRPIANTRIYVLDREGQPVPVGVAGEICIGGDSVARGYLNQPRLTAERFVQDPFHGGRMYRTGDLGRWLADGNIDYLGRLDSQVKLRGFRIELGEIEAVLQQHAQVGQAVVMLREDEAGDGDQKLVAYVVGKGDAVPDVEQLRQALKTKLPEYMVPGAFVALQALPLSPNGKVDTKALPAPSGERQAGSDYVEPGTRTERELASIWSSVLKVDRVGVHDNFFELGGHSLLATRVASQIAAALGREVPLRELFHRPRLGELAAYLDGHTGVQALAPIGLADRSADLPLSYAQQRLWFLDRYEPQSAAYNIPMALRLLGTAVDAARLQAVFARLIARHESLRTVFEMRNGQSVQVIHETLDVPVAFEDLSGLSEGARQAKAALLLEQEAAKPFDLARGPLLRVGLLKFGGQEHVLLLTMHHIVSDGWSMDVLVNEVAQIYRAQAEGGDANLPPLAIQYADYAVWQRERLQGEVLQEQLGYWRAQLEGAPALLELPTDRPRPAVLTHHGANVEFQLGEELTDRLQQLAQARGTTLFMLTQAAFAILLHRLSGQDDICVGTPIAGRGRAELEGLIGFFANTLVLRSRIDPNASFDALLAQSRDVALGAYAHQDVPFEQLVEHLKPPRSLSYTPLFQVMFILQNAPRETLDVPGLRLEMMPSPTHTAKFDLTCSLAQGNARLYGNLEFNTGLFDEATVARMAQHYEVLLQSICDQPAASLKDLPLLTPVQRNQVLVEWNATQAPYPPDVVHRLVEEQARRSPNAVALAYGQEQLTYAQLNARANQLAHHLVQLGVGPERLVGICMERSLQMVVGLLAVLKAGGAYVPLDPGYPKDRLAYMLADAKPQVLLTQESLLGQLPAGEGAVLCLDRDWPQRIAMQPTDDPRHQAQPHNLVYVIYTSGSTGLPKGVGMPHGGLANLLHWQRAVLPQPARTLQFAALGFDVAAQEIFSTLATGGTLVLLDEARRQDMPALVKWLAGQGIQRLFLPYVALGSLGELWKDQQLPQLQDVITAGEQLRITPALRRLFTVNPQARLHNHYGPTESHVACAQVLAGPAQAWNDLPPIGRPVANTRIYILDAQGQPVPPGVAGEIHIAGAQVAREYLGRPGLTAERFIGAPDAGVLGERMYKTGDLGRWREGGVIDYLGRNDLQVKIRGFRIELGEVEARLAECDGVREAAVIAREDQPGDKRLVAYVVAQDDVQPPSAAALRAQLGQSLPEYMVPGAFVVLEALPLTPNGKLDRKALPEPGGERQAGNDYVEPATPTERALAAIWAGVLQVDQVGLHDNFFELGGHSLLATRVVSQIGATLGREMPLRELFHKPRLQELAAWLDGRPATTGPAPIGVAARPADGLPLSYAQQRLWFLDNYESGSAFYNMGAALRLRGKGVTPALLHGVFNALVARHEALRTVFRVVNGQPRQVIAQLLELPMLHEDLSGLPDTARQARAAQLLEQETGKPFDLTQGPLLRVGLVKLGEDEHILLLTMHHIVSDGWSMGVLVDEVAQIYRALGEGQQPMLPPLVIQYADYAVWQRERLQGEVLHEQLGYWRNQLEGAPALLELPTDRPRPTLQSHRGAVHGFELSTQLTASLSALAQAQSTTLFMLLQSAFAVLLHRLSGQEDICVGTPIAGRNRAELEGLIGFFVNTLVLRNRIDPRASFDALLEQSKDIALAAYAHQDVPFEQLVEHLNPPRSQGYTPLFQVMFMLQNAPRQTLEIPGLAFEMLPGSTGTAKYDLTCSMVEGQDRQGRDTLYGTLEYSTDLFEAATAARMAQHYEVLLQGICDAPAAPVAALPLLTPAQERQLLVEWNDTAAPYQLQAVHQLFEEQARRTPDAVALVDGTRQLSYAQFDARASQLAHHLVQLGVRPDVLVGICMERSTEMVVALVAVLKAGGAYVPLDPGYPKDRLAYMLDDAKPRVLLTQQTLLEQLPSYEGKVLCVDGDWHTRQAPAGNEPLPSVSPAHLAYVIYTSGSTGTPKGAGISHAALANHTQWMQQRFPLEAGDRVLQKTPFSFDASVWEFWSPLAAGATLVVAEPGAQRDPARLAQLLAQTRTTVVQFVPALLAALLEEDLSDCRSLRHVFVGGEALPAALAARSRAVLGAEVVNLYGPTEACIDALFAVADASAEAGAMVPIGRPVANTRAYVLDAQLHPVPVGVAGELYLAGPGLARGYLHQPALTAERFLPDPFAAAPGARMYRTGDLVRRLPGGTLDYLGRADQQVKVRGFRIELGEIESVLRQDPRVAQAVAVVREDVPGERRLVAYVVSQQDDGLDADRLRQALQARLPEYMVPGAFVLLQSLPLTPSGKVDRNALPSPSGERQLTTDYVAPESVLEKSIAAAWADVLQVERVGLHDNFFALGGHSLLALALVTRLREQGLAADVKSLFTAPTVAGVARAMERGGIAAIEVPPNRIDPQAEAITPGMLPLVELTQAEIDLIAAKVPGGARNVQDLYPLSPQQEGLLYHHLLDPDDDAYTVSLAFAVRTREQLDAIGAALQQVVQRHDILRTAFLWEGLREPVQVVLREAPLPIAHVVLDPRDGDILAQLQARFGRRRQRMDVDRAPLVRLHAAPDPAQDRWVLLIVNHHMVSDHVTMEVVMEEAGALLLGLAQALPAPLPFRNLVAQARRERSRADQDAFFRQLLESVTQPSMPFNLLADESDAPAPEERTSMLEPALAARIRAAARTAKVSAASLFHFAWALVLARAGGKGDVVFGTVLFGRMAVQAGAERAVGLFTNTLPFRIDTDQGDVVGALQRTQEVLAGLLAHEHASLVLVQRHSQLPPQTPLFSALLNYRHTQARKAQDETAADPLGVRMLDGREGTHYPLMLTVDELGDGGFLLGAQVRPSIGAEHVCCLVRTAIEGIVDALEGGRSTAASELEVLAAADRAQLLHEWNATVLPYPRDKTVHQLFEEQARRSPDAVALVHGHQRLTYAQLDARANQLAHRLRALGVGPEVLVALCVERGLDMVVGLLGILKAGGAYVPLDPAYPSARLAYMLGDAKPAVLLTTSATVLPESVSVDPESISVRPELVEGPLPAGASTSSARTGAGLLCLDRDWDAQVATHPAEQLPNLAQPQNLAYMIYTSGSTGQPKGTQIAHRAVVNLLATMAHSPGMQADDVLLAVTSLSFDIAALEIFLPLATGAQVVIASREQAADAQALKDLVRTHAVTVMQATPSTWRMLQASDGADLRLRLALCGGEAMDAPLAKDLCGIADAAWNLYGPTETTVWSSAERLGANAQVTLGQPLANTQMYILDDQLRLVPRGAVGELHIGGEGLARGYLHQPGLTAKKFIPNPHGAPGSRLYKTGDLARHLRDGRIEFLGRSDQQMKLRGFRIELGEIEAVLRALPAVREAAVAMHGDAPGDERLVAYVATRSQVDAHDILAHAKQQLPAHMVPAQVVLLDALPRTPNGKLDRKALPAPDWQPRETGFVAPRTATEQALAAIWSEVLQQDTVGVHDDFFALGGHSLLAVQVVWRVRRQLAPQLPLSTLLASPTVAALAAQIDGPRTGTAPAGHALAHNPPQQGETT
ncbi:non-ribosomal peptide synthase/polyketide synthase, partial [Ramlibacter sp.]|uniref:non-ribosomal peptide synthase/polyketide synthase n=1 Tax=Ramlibacter sp. TaxID=1917967 RepID=UPI0017D46668